MMKDCRGSVIWQSDQWMRGQIGIDCDRLVNGQPWSWLMTLNLNLIWSTHNNILSSRQGKRTKQIELALIFFVPSSTPATQDSFLITLLCPNTITHRGHRLSSGYSAVSDLCCVICSVGSSTRPVLGSVAARGNVGCDTLLCHWG